MRSRSKKGKNVKKTGKSPALNATQEGNVIQDVNVTEEGNDTQDVNDTQEGNVTQKKKVGKKRNVRLRKKVGLKRKATQERNDTQEGDVAQEIERTISDELPEKVMFIVNNKMFRSIQSLGLDILTDFENEGQEYDYQTFLDRCRESKQLFEPFEDEQ